MASQGARHLQLQQELFRLLFLIRGRMKDIVQDADADLSPMHILVLRTLVEEGDMPQSSLVKKMRRDKAQVTRLVNELEKQKLLVKTRDEQDKRSFILKPATQVRKKVQYFIGKEQALVAQMLAGISDRDIEKLEALLVRMQVNLVQREVEEL